MLKNKLLFILIFFTFGGQSKAIEPKDHVIFARVNIDTVGKLKAVITWEADTNAKDYRIKRKTANEDSWNLTLAELDSTATSFTDSTIESGLSYEYSLMKNCSFPTDSTLYTYEGYSYLFAGSKVNVADNRGKLLLLVDRTISESLETEIDRLVYDLTGDGWNVIRQNVDRTEEFNGDAVRKVKELIVNEYDEAKGDLKSLLLLGRIAVPYSGNFAIDGHEDHKGAWVADTYYADIDGVWTDEAVRDTIADRKENRNIPGDGKFDQNQIPSDIELETGRIDFYNLNYYGKSEIEMIRKYLNKNHDYRQGIIKPEKIGIIEDHFGLYAELSASNGWMEFSGLLGPDNVRDEKFMLPLNTEPRYWAFGCGSGSYNSIVYTVYVDQLDTMNTGGIFSLFFGSYNGDWDWEDNVMRSVLAYSPFSLTCSWVGRPYWHFHHMGLGYTIGYSTKVSQNNQALYESNGKHGYRYVHVSLLGDPTLRMHVEAPAKNLYLSSEVSMDSSKVFLTWEDDNERLIGFNIYRSNDIYKKFEKINDNIITDYNFVDRNPMPGKNIYSLRAVRLTETATGSIVNMSQGVIAETYLPLLSYSSKLDYSLKCYPNPAETYTNISYVVSTKERVNVSIWNLEGRFVNEITNSILNPGYYLQSWNLRNELGEIVQSGIYLIKFTTKNKSIVAKLNVIH